MAEGCLEPRAYPTTFEHRYELKDFVTRLGNRYSCENPLNKIPSPLHIFEQIACRSGPQDVCVMWPDFARNAYDQISYKKTRDFTGRLLAHLKKSVLAGVVEGDTVAVLCDDNPGMFFLLLALYWGGYVTLILSTRNAAPAVRTMCVEARAKVLISSAATLSQSLHEDSIRVCEYSKITLDFLSHLPPAEIPSLSKSASSDFFEQVRFVLHTSGSTRFPTLVRIPNRWLLVSALAAHSWSRAATHVSLNIGPLFHAMSFVLTFCGALCGCTAACFPLAPAFPPRPSEIMMSIRLLNPTRLSAVPVILQALCDFADADASGIEWQLLRQLPLITFGGAPMPTSMRETIQRNRLNVKGDYGSTEAGPTMKGRFWLRDDSYSNLVMGDESSYVFLPSPDSAEAYQLVILKESITLAAVEYNHPLGYQTNDFFALRGEGVWQYLGRQNDTLVHSSGEKTNALQLECDIKDCCPLIQRVGVFGSGKPNTSAIIQLDWDRVGDSARTVNEILFTVHSAIQKANENAPSHSRVSGQSVFCLLPGIELPVTAKGNVARSKAEREFEDVLSSIGHVASPLASRLVSTSMGLAASNQTFKSFMLQNKKQQVKLTEGELARTIASELSTIVDMPMDEIMAHQDENFLDYGVTSQMTAQLHPILEQVLEREVAPTLPYEFPSIRSLTRACLQSQYADFDLEQAKAAVSALIASYKSAIDQWAAFLEISAEPKETPAVKKPRLEGKVYLLTGASGGLGIELVRVLSTQCRTSKVVCLLRGADPMRRLRHIAAEKAVTDLIDWAKIEVHNYNMKDQFLGMDPATYRDVRNQTTDVIHNAWRLNFNHGVDQYAKDCLPSVLNLIKFCSATSVKKSLTFISSISAVGKCPLAPEAAFVPEVHIQSFDWVMPFGYAHSKYVGEEMCLYAAEILKLRTNVIRCGQLSGDRHGGAWNVKDFFSLLICGGAQELKKMPATKYPADIVPMDVAGCAVADIVESDSRCQIFHIANPQGGSWDHFLDLLRENGLYFQVVEHEKFYQEVKQRPENPCFVLLPWLYGDMKSSGVVPILDCTNTLQVSPALRDCPPVSSSLVRTYLDQWKKCGFLRD